MEKAIDIRLQIHQLVSDILKEDVPVKLLQLTRQLFDSLLEIVNPVVPIDADQTDMIVQSGKALSPYSAASSIKDLYRTQRFMRGLLTAIEDLRVRHPEDCLHVVYAGTGPFAILAFPVMFAYSGRHVKFTFLDIHQDALRALTYLLDLMNFNDHVDDLVCMDATQYSLPSDRKTHLVITETMQKALLKETQVGITLHLAPQTDPDTIWIPESILIEAALVNNNKDIERMMGSLKEGDTHLQPLGTLLNLSKSTALSMVQKRNTPEKYLDPVTFHLPEWLVKDYPSLSLTTTVHVYGPHKLLPYESSITLSHELQDLNGLEKAPASVDIFYRLGNDPGFEYRFD